MAIIAAGGIVALSAAAPNLIGALGKINSSLKHLSKKDKAERIKREIYYLKKSGQIKIKRTAKEVFISLTRLGRKKLPKIAFHSLHIPKQKHWNHRWWQVAADIPTKDYRNAADALRTKLKQMGFYSLQRTLWFYPFDPRRELQFLINHYRISQFVTVMEVSRLDKADERILKSHFKNCSIL